MNMILKDSKKGEKHILWKCISCHRAFPHAYFLISRYTESLHCEHRDFEKYEGVRNG